MRVSSMSWLSVLLLVPLFLSMVGCPKPYGSARWPSSREQKPTVVLEPGAGDDASTFYRAPFPSLARMQGDAVDVRHLPNPFGVGFVDEGKGMVQARQGASPYAVTTFLFDGPLPVRAAVPLMSARSDASIQLVSLSEGHVGERQLIDVQMTQQRDTVRPAHLLQIMPLSGRPLRPGRYAAVVMRDLDGDGVIDAERSPAMEMALGMRPADPALSSWASASLPLVSQAAALHLDLEQVAAATVFDVGDETAWVRQYLQNERTLPVSDVHFDNDAPAYETHVELRGSLRQPILQPGEPPFLIAGDDGVIVIGTDGKPTVHGEVDAPFVLTFPPGKMPADGFPLMLYVHGTGGSPTQATDRGFKPRPGIPNHPGVGLASTVASSQVATACIAGPYSPDRIGWRALDGYGAYTFFHPRAMHDNFVQMLLEHTRFLAWLEHVAIDASRVPGVDASASVDGKIRFDVSKIIVSGHSLGSYLAGMMAGIHDAFAGVVLSGAGGSWVEFGFGPKDPIDLQALLETISLPPGEHYDRFHPFIMMFQHAVAAADNTLYTSMILNPINATRRTPHVLIMEGEPDAQVPTLLQRALVRSLGVPLVGQDVGARPELRLLPGLHAMGIDRVHTAIANIDTPTGKRTGGVVRFAEDGHLDGHSVIFNRPDARQVLWRFVDDIARGHAPVISPAVRTTPYVVGETTIGDNHIAPQHGMAPKIK
jgi:hypothetical protein